MDILQKVRRYRVEVYPAFLIKPARAEEREEKGIYTLKRKRSLRGHTTFQDVDETL